MMFGMLDRVCPSQPQGITALVRYTGVRPPLIWGRTIRGNIDTFVFILKKNMSGEFGIVYLLLCTDADGKDSILLATISCS